MLMWNGLQAMYLSTDNIFLYCMIHLMIVTKARQPGGWDVTTAHCGQTLIVRIGQTTSACIAAAHCGQPLIVHG